jgi:hypothetical protein
MKNKIFSLLLPLFFCLGLQAFAKPKAETIDLFNKIATLYHNLVDLETPMQEVDQNVWAQVSLDEKEFEAFSKLLASFHSQLIAYRDYRDQYENLLSKSRKISFLCACGLGISGLLILPEVVFDAGQNVCFRPQCYNNSPAFNIGGNFRCFDTPMAGRCARYSYHKNPDPTLQSLSFEPGCHPKCPEELAGQLIPNRPATIEGRADCLAKFGGWFSPIIVFASGCITAECINLSTTVKECLTLIKKLRKTILELRENMQIDVAFLGKFNDGAFKNIAELMKVAFSWSLPEGREYITDELGQKINREIEKGCKDVLRDIFF